MSVIQLNDQNFEAEVEASALPVLVDFYAVWCGPCKMVAPVMDELATKYDGKVKFAKLDVDESPKVAEKYGVMSIPTVIVMKDGKEVGRQVGFGGKEAYENMVKKIV